MSRKDKKQQSLLDFPSLRKHSSVAASCKDVIVIDDNEADFVESALKIEQTISTSFVETVECPICLVSLAPFQIDLRVRHVELCLAKDGQCGRNEGPSQKIGKTLKEEKTAKRPLGLVQVQRAKYVNSVEAKKKRKVKTEYSADTEPEKPRELLVSTKKYEIPELKILRFYASSTQEYCVSVDAFCYKPHEVIRQYFLSHFHSDHYGGITKRWSLERTVDSKIIYCSSITGRLLGIRFNIDPMFIFDMKNETRYKVFCYTKGELENGGFESEDVSPGLYVVAIDANHCPGAVIFLFESIPHKGETTYYLHCGDFRINDIMLNHPLLRPFHLNGSKELAKVYLDTTYMNPDYNFPKQEQVCNSVSQLVHDITQGKEMVTQSFGKTLQSRITQFLPLSGKEKGKKCLVLVGTYLIGKERIATSILKKMKGCPIYVSNINSRGDKTDIIRAFHDKYLDSVLTSDPLGLDKHAVVVHLVPMKIVGTLKELTNYFNFNKYHDTFERCIGLRPTGWTFQAEGDIEENELGNDSSYTDLGEVSTINLLKNPKSYSVSDILKQNPYTAKKYAKFDPSTFRIFSLPYSEHLSFRELCFFVVFLKIGRVIPTVNTHNDESRGRMAKTIAEWEGLRRRLIASSLDSKSSNRNTSLVSLSDF